MKPPVRNHSGTLKPRTRPSERRDAPLTSAIVQPRGEREGPHVVVVGDCAAGDGLAMEAESEIVVHAHVGQEVELVYRYAFVPEKEERDFFRVALVSRIGATAPPPRLYQTQERRGLRSPLRGFLAHRYAFRAPGLYEGVYALRAETIAQSRTSSDVLSWKTATREGRVRLLVGDVATSDAPVVI